MMALYHYTSAHGSGWNNTQSTTNWAIFNKLSWKNTTNQSLGSALVIEDVMKWDDITRLDSS